MRKIIFLLTILLAYSVFLFAQPKGIYVLDNNQGTYRDANIRNYSFVDGFVWRTSWQDIETAQGVYNYAGVDHIIHRLDSIGKKLTILFGAYSVEPSYIALQTGVTTYAFTDPISNITTNRAVPYDGYLLQRFRFFLSALANHPVYSLATGTMVVLKDHPVLSNIATNIPGLGAIRNVNGLNTGVHLTLPGYSRSKFVDSILTGMKVQTDNFPAKNVFIPSYKNITDNINAPSLSVFIRSQLLSNFNGIQNPRISFWQENLAGFTDTVTHVFTGLPTTVFATPLYQLGDSAYTMFQMLQGWTTPFLDPTKTANSTPFDAMCYAYTTFGSSYYEIYVSDIDNLVYRPMFNAWDPVVSCAITLAVDFMGITARRTANAVKVEWQVSGEDGMRNYEIQKSLDGRSFSTVGSVLALNNSATNLNYHFTDTLAPAANVFYRIKSVSINGQTKFSSIVLLAPDEGKAAMTISPNPVQNGIVHLQCRNLPTGIYTLTVISTTGQVVLTRSINHSGGSGSQSFSLPKGIANGLYMVEMIAPGKIRTAEKLMVM